MQSPVAISQSGAVYKLTPPQPEKKQRQQIKERHTDSDDGVYHVFFSSRAFGRTHADAASFGDEVCEHPKTETGPRPVYNQSDQTFCEVAQLDTKTLGAASIGEIKLGRSLRGEKLYHEGTAVHALTGLNVLRRTLGTER